MKLNIGDLVMMRVEESGSYVIHAQVEDSSKGDVIQAKVTSIKDSAGQEVSEPGTLPYRVGKVDSFDRKLVLEKDPQA